MKMKKSCATEIVLLHNTLVIIYTNYKCAMKKYFSSDEFQKKKAFSQHYQMKNGYLNCHILWFFLFTRCHILKTTT
jgi:hypothetical protein